MASQPKISHAPASTSGIARLSQICRAVLSLGGDFSNPAKLGPTSPSSALEMYAVSRLTRLVHFLYLVARMVPYTVNAIMPSKTRSWVFLANVVGQVEKLSAS
jgi:hypothetical protein